jgi:hypothetical protein
MKMLEQFCGHRFDLSALADIVRKKHGSRYTMEVSRDDAYIETQDFESTFMIAEFMLNRSR